MAALSSGRPFTDPPGAEDGRYGLDRPVTRPGGREPVQVRYSVAAVFVDLAGQVGLMAALAQ